MSRNAALTCALALTLVPVAGCSGSGSRPDESTGASGELTVEVVADGLSNPWDVAFLEDGGALVTERGGRLSYLPSLDPGTEPVEIDAGLDDVYAEGEGGLLGMALLPAAEPEGSSGSGTTSTSSSSATGGSQGWDLPRVAVCLNHEEDGEVVDIRLVELTVDVANRRATRDRDLLTGLPSAQSGRHSGCRPTLGPDGMLYVGTGDTADPDVPQDRTVLGGKVLRLDPATGEPPADNPFADSADEAERYVWTYGHRNVQGVAARPGTEEMWSAEHGPSFDDEVNELRAGANYGWDPSQGGTVDDYDESVPMTDTERFPDAVEARWRSGKTTEAICGATFLDGDQWGDREGMLAITALKGAKLLLLRVEGEGADATVGEVEIPKDIVDEYGRLRAARSGPDGALYVTTSNGDDDKVLRITPAT